MISFEGFRAALDDEEARRALLFREGRPYFVLMSQQFDRTDPRGPVRHRHGDPPDGSAPRRRRLPARDPRRQAGDEPVRAALDAHLRVVRRRGREARRLGAGRLGPLDELRSRRGSPSRTRCARCRASTTPSSPGTPTTSSPRARPVALGRVQAADPRRVGRQRQERAPHPGAARHLHAPLLVRAARRARRQARPAGGRHRPEPGREVARAAAHAVQHRRARRGLLPRPPAGAGVPADAARRRRGAHLPRLGAAGDRRRRRTISTRSTSPACSRSGTPAARSAPPTTSYSTGRSARSSVRTA